MATESSLAVTAGAGVNLHTVTRTIGAATVHDQGVFLDEPPLAGYTISPLASVSTATANSHLLQVMAGASLLVRIRRIEFYQNAMATAVFNMGVSIFRLSTAGTGGTAITAAPLDTTSAASGATGMTLPTVKGTESTLMWRGRAYMMQTLAVSSNLNQPTLVIDFDRLRTGPLLIAAGAANGIAIKNTDAVAAGTVDINVWIDETSFA